MNTFSTSWSCTRCGAAFIGTQPEHGLCDQCLTDLEAIARMAPITSQPCPVCGGPVCGDCGKALIVLLPTEPGGLAAPAREVSGDDG